jgi:alpha-beta hydrolase superfamily lysophospholipase
VHADWFGPGPALVAPARRPRGTVLLLHGLHGDALGNHHELAMLQGAGFHAIGIDAPEHGRRSAHDRFDRWNADLYGELSRHAPAAGAEMPDILDAVHARGLVGPYAVMGISLGAHTAWCALLADPRLRAAALFLGSPELRGAGSPHLRLDALRGRRILALNATRDEAVPLEPTVRAVAALPHAELHRFEDSPHAVPGPMWWEGCGRMLRFFHEHLS